MAAEMAATRPRDLPAEVGEAAAAADADAAGRLPGLGVAGSADACRRLAAGDSGCGAAGGSAPDSTSLRLARDGRAAAMVVAVMAVAAVATAAAFSRGSCGLAPTTVSAVLYAAAPASRRKGAGLFFAVAGVCSSAAARGKHVSAAAIMVSAAAAAAAAATAAAPGLRRSPPGLAALGAVGLPTCDMAAGGRGGGRAARWEKGKGMT